MNCFIVSFCLTSYSHSGVRLGKLYLSCPSWYCAGTTSIVPTELAGFAPWALVVCQINFDGSETNHEGTKDTKEEGRRNHQYGSEWTRQLVLDRLLVANPNIQPIATLQAKITNMTMSSWRFSRLWDLLLTRFDIRFSIYFCVEKRFFIWEIP